MHSLYDKNTAAFDLGTKSIFCLNKLLIKLNLNLDL